jgi:hypothetical protein
MAGTIHVTVEGPEGGQRNLFLSTELWEDDKRVALYLIERAIQGLGGVPRSSPSMAGRHEYVSEPHPLPP